MLNELTSVNFTMKIPGFMTTQEAADYLEISAGRVRQLVSLNILPHESVGNTNLIPVSAVEAYKENRPKAGWPKGKLRK
jgi:excisionase family DNA binding protein